MTNSSQNNNLESNNDWTKGMYESIGISHIGFRVDNLDDTIEKIKKLGGKLVKPPFKFEPKIMYSAEHENEKLKRASIPLMSKKWWKIASFSDPDGILLEIVER
jgi:catechol 2,3-dioxygenase-like lactoylglutathione lyase family enzyme